MNVKQYEDAEFSLCEAYPLHEHIKKLIEETDELKAAANDFYREDLHRLVAETDPRAVHLLEEMVDVEIVIGHIRHLLADVNPALGQSYGWMREYKLSRQMIRLLTKDETFGSTKCRVES